MRDSTQSAAAAAARTSTDPNPQRATRPSAPQGAPPTGAPPAHARDWPGPGPIDLSVHDLPHDSATLEWWYLNCHLRMLSGRELSVFAAFFRQAASVDSNGAFEYAHSISWAVCAPNESKYWPKVAVDDRAPALGLEKLGTGAGQDQRLNRALREVLERGKIPGPTQMFDEQASVSREQLDLRYGSERLHKLPSGAYRVDLCDEANDISCRLTFTLKKPPTRHGVDGVIHGVADEQMFYYFVPRCEVSGSVTIRGQVDAVVEGSGWYDHEFGAPPEGKTIDKSEAATAETSWRWASVQLDDGTDVSFFLITRRSTGEVLDNWTILSAPNGEAQSYGGATLEVLEYWQSQRSFVEYPTRFRLSLPAAGLELELRAAFGDQEVLTVISDPGFWEGRIEARGTLRGVAARGRGWLECKGFRFSGVSSFLDAVGKQVRGRLSQLLPRSRERRELSQLVVRGDDLLPDPERYIEGVDQAALIRSLVNPIREIADRGGKGWRSYAALACIDVVGGDSRNFGHWLPMPELLHVGSLIIDDVEDASDVRRGGPTCHLVHGQNHAINAGTAAYFLAEPPVWNDDLPLQVKLRVYRLYFDALRAGHAGQALDLEGLMAVATRAADLGESTNLERQIMAIHQLKTATPAGMMARVGALLGGGTEAQVEALGTFFEAVGFAFQIVDDVLNLRGFEGDLKERGEDIRQGKITLPVAMAFSRLTLGARRTLLATVASPPASPAAVREAIAAIEECGALDACMSLARERVERAWLQLDPLIQDSQSKVMFRAFSWFVLERHY